MKSSRFLDENVVIDPQFPVFAEWCYKRGFR